MQAEHSPVYISAHRVESITTIAIPRWFAHYKADSSLLLKPLEACLCIKVTSMYVFVCPLVYARPHKWIGVHVADRFNEVINKHFHITINTASLCSKADCFFPRVTKNHINARYLSIYLFWFLR